MSLDNIQLSGPTCEILFSHNLIGNPSSDIKNDLPEKDKINSLGDNQKQILFLVKEGNYIFLPDNEMELLTNLLSACNLSMADIALVNFYKNPSNYQAFNEQFSPVKILSFGINTQELELPFTIPLFQIQKFQSQSYLLAPPLKDLLDNKILKKDLWQCLQKMFPK